MPKHCISLAISAVLSNEIDSKAFSTRIIHFRTTCGYPMPGSSLKSTGHGWNGDESTIAHVNVCVYPFVAVVDPISGPSSSCPRAYLGTTTVPQVLHRTHDVHVPCFTEYRFLY